MEQTAKKLIETDKVYTNFYTFEGVVKALNGVCVQVNHGETYGLVGESGCGKSVTVRSMMQIVQAPGVIEGGRILLFQDKEGERKGIDLLKRSNAYMRSIRGDDISMIFQEASASLNPVLTIGYQIGESFLFHRRAEMLEKAIERIKTDLQGKTLFPVKIWRKFQLSLLNKEHQTQLDYREKVNKIDTRLYELEEKTDARSMREKRRLNMQRGEVSRFHPLSQFFKHVPFLSRYYKILHKIVKEEAVELLKTLGVPNSDNVVERYPHEISGGMQQRIVIAIALACHPTMLIADEPTSNLDVTIQAQIIELIKRLKETKISSVLFITHDLGLVSEICDRVTVMYAGDADETAKVKDLFANPLHPYTKALLNSVPKLNQKERLNTIPGTVPNLVRAPSGCRFHPRCPHAMDVCAKIKPRTIEYKPGHTVACHLYYDENEYQKEEGAK